MNSAESLRRAEIRAALGRPSQGEASFYLESFRDFSEGAIEAFSDE